MMIDKKGTLLRQIGILSVKANHSIHTGLKMSLNVLEF